MQEVIIIGGGLVGFSLSLMLAKKNIKSVLLETKKFPEKKANVVNDSYISLDSRNTALSRKSVEIYQQLGLWDKLQSHAMPILEVNITEQNSFGKARLLAHEEKVESFGQAIENRWLGNVLLDEARQNPCIKLIDEATITKLEQCQQQVTITYQKQNQEHQLNTGILIGCDGQNSSCRKLLGVSKTVKDYQQSAIVSVVETSKPHDQVAFERFSKHGPLAMIPLAGKYEGDQSRRSVVWIAKKGEEAQFLGKQNDDFFLSTLQNAYGDRAGQFLKTGVRNCYPLSKILSEQQVVGRVVLLGNAAHTLHPVAGQGFNLCLRDANVCANTLANYLETCHDFSDFIQINQYLVAYEQSRLTDQKRVIKFCDAIISGFGTQNIFIKWTRNAGLIAFDSIPGMKQLVANYAMGLKS